MANDLPHGGDGGVLYGGPARCLAGRLFGDVIFMCNISMAMAGDTINDGVTASYTLAMVAAMATLCTRPNVLLSQVYVARQADNLWPPVWPMLAMVDHRGVVITNFFQGGIYTIEYLRTQDAVISLSVLSVKFDLAAGKLVFTLAFACTFVHTCSCLTSWRSYASQYQRFGHAAYHQKATHAEDDGKLVATSW